MTAVDTLGDLRPATPTPLDEPIPRRLAALFSCALHMAAVAGLVSHWPASPAFGPSPEVVEVEIVEPIEPAPPASPTSAPAAATEPPASPQTERSVEAPTEPPPAAVDDGQSDDRAPSAPPPTTEAADSVVAPVPAPPSDPVADVAIDDRAFAPPRPTIATPRPSPKAAAYERSERPAVVRSAEHAARLERAETAATKRKSEAPTVTASSRSSTVGSASRSSAGAGGRDALAAYLAVVKAQIVGRRRLHVGAERGRVEVRFVVAADGSIGGVRGASFASPALEDEAMRLVRRASPVAPIPVALGRTSLAMSVTVEFE